MIMTSKILIQICIQGSHRFLKAAFLTWSSIQVYLMTMMTTMSKKMIGIITWMMGVPRRTQGAHQARLIQSLMTRQGAKTVNFRIQDAVTEAQELLTTTWSIQVSIQLSVQRLVTMSAWT